MPNFEEKKKKPAGHETFLWIQGEQEVRTRLVFIAVEDYYALKVLANFIKLIGRNQRFKTKLRTWPP